MNAKVEENVKSSGVPSPAPFASKLPEGWQRFLAHAIENGFEVGQRTPEDFIRHFPPAAIMMGLEDEPELRANILIICTGVRAKIALKKSAESCGEDLQIALDEGETDAESVVTLFDPDDRVRYLDRQALWAYVTEQEFWKNDPQSKPAEHARAASHIAYILDRALADGLITHQEIVEGITTARIAELLPREELGKIIAGALSNSHDKRPFSEQNLLAVVPPSTLTKHVPLRIVWEQVVAPKIASRHKLVPGPVPKPPPVAAAEESPSDEGAAEEGDLDMDIDDVLDAVEPGGKKKKKSNGKSVPPAG